MQLTVLQQKFPNSKNGKDIGTNKIEFITIIFRPSIQSLLNLIGIREQSSGERIRRLFTDQDHKDCSSRAVLAVLFRCSSLTKDLGYISTIRTKTWVIFSRYEQRLGLYFHDTNKDLGYIFTIRTKTWVIFSRYEQRLGLYFHDTNKDLGYIFTIRTKTWVIFSRYEQRLGLYFHDTNKNLGYIFTIRTKTWVIFSRYEQRLGLYFHDTNKDLGYIFTIRTDWVIFSRYEQTEYQSLRSCF